MDLQSFHILYGTETADQGEYFAKNFNRLQKDSSAITTSTFGFN